MLFLFFLVYLTQWDIIKNIIKDIKISLINLKKQNDNQNNKIIKPENNINNDKNEVNNNIKIKKEKSIEKCKQNILNINKIKKKKKKVRNSICGNFISERKSKSSRLTLERRKSVIVNILSDKEKKSHEIEAEDITEYNSYEKNELPYDLALKYDKRKYTEYYISLLREKHNLIFSFFNNKDYNSRVIKYDLFFIGFTIYYTINALFFNDDMMHKIYVSEGSYSIEYKMVTIIYSSLISLFLNKLLKSLALSNDSIIKFKQDKKKNDVEQRETKLISKIKIKLIIYYIISFIFLLFFWYYLSIFGAVYRNSQYHLLVDTLVSFGLSLLYPIGIYLLPGLFRIPALSAPKKNRKYLYNFSKLLQLLC